MGQIPYRSTIARELLARKVKMKVGGQVRLVTLEQAIIMKLKQIAIEKGEPWALKLIEKIVDRARAVQANRTFARTLESR